MLITVILLAVVGPFVAPEPVGRTVGRPFDPNGDGPFGTGAVGRNVWSELLHGGRRMVLAPLVITAIATLVGTFCGAVAAASNSARRLVRVLDVVAVIPPLLLLLLMLYRLGSSLVVVGLAVVLISAPYITRYMRTIASPVVHSDYVEHAFLMGEPRLVTLRRHVLPNLAGPVLADAALRVAGTVYVLTAASFLGFGPASPATDWAVMVSDGMAGVSLNLWAVAAPAIAIGGFAISLNLLSDQVGDWWRTK